MTTIYELEKQATPGKAVAIHGEGTCFHPGNLDSIQCLSGMDADEECWETVSEFWPTAPKTQAKTDAQMYAYCRNHFMEALRALIAEHDWRMNLRYETKGEKHIPETCPTCKVIKKMETIE